MKLTLWTNMIDGQRLSEDELVEMRRRAHCAYEANRHIFEDEAEALAALGVVAYCEYTDLDRVCPSPAA
jgi:hypothetical protein